MSKRKLWLSGRKKINGVSERQTMPSTIKSQSAKYFRQIDKLPLSRFVDCVVDNNLHALVIEGSPHLTELEAAFTNIYQQYTDMMGDGEYKHFISSWKALIKINLIITQVEEIIKALKLFPYVPLFDELNKLLKIDFRFDYADRKEYFKLLDRAYKRSRGLVIERDLLQIRFDTIKEKLRGNGDKKITRAYFIDWLILLGNHVQMIITDQITVYEFCERIRQYNRFVEREKMRK
ncbi:MAG: hypothetical protein KF862_07205 [Chitinophagaceae bacterium]|nr:hypothetical protein [Chitinophagaceae bacterium]